MTLRCPNMRFCITPACTIAEAAFMVTGRSKYAKIRHSALLARSRISDYRDNERPAKQRYVKSITLNTVDTVATKLNMSDLDVSRMFEFAKELTLEAGKMVKRGLAEDKQVQTKQVEWDLVTIFDQKVEDMMTSAILKEFPDHKVIGEEAASALKYMPQLTDEPTWFLDPIDGTTNFVHHFPMACISLGLVVNKSVVLGIIYNPFNSELYTAQKGQGAFLNDEPIHTSENTEMKKSLLAFEPAMTRYGLKNRDIQVGRLEALTNATRGIRNLGSAALTLAYVARGVLDCFHMDGLKPWDVVAGILLVREAGGVVIDTKGGPYNIMKPYTIAAAGESLAQELTQLIVDTDLKTQRKRLQRS